MHFFGFKSNNTLANSAILENCIIISWSCLFLRLLMCFICSAATELCANISCITCVKVRVCKRTQCVCTRVCVWLQVCDRSRVWQLVVCTSLPLFLFSAHEWERYCWTQVCVNVASPSSRVFICSVSADLIRLYHGKSRPFCRLVF